jgi:large subunit ribosomal protein L30
MTAVTKTVRPKAPAKVAHKPTEHKGHPSQMIAAVLIRGREMGVRHDVKRSLNILRLLRRHICVVIPDNESNRGLLDKCKDLLTYGPISDETLAMLNEKRGSLKNREGKALNVFRMHPPRGGWGHKGIKVAYAEGGCLGQRRKGMDELLRKMM